MPRQQESRPKRWYITSMFKIVEGCYLDAGYAVLCDPKSGKVIAFASFHQARHCLKALKDALTYCEKD